MSPPGRYPISLYGVLQEWRDEWHQKAHKHQTLPSDPAWQTQLLLGGRGCGKSKALSENLALLMVEHGSHYPIRGLITAATTSDLKFTIFEGDSGLLDAIPPIFIRDYNRSSFEITFAHNIGHLRGISAQEPSRLRGPQFSILAADELAAYTYSAEMMMQYDMCMRLKHPTLLHPRRIIATTPKAIPVLWDLVAKAADPANKIFIESATTYANKSNLADTFITGLASYAGTQIGSQEIYGILSQPGEGAIIRKSWLKIWPKTQVNNFTHKEEPKPLPRFSRVVLSVDPAYSDEPETTKARMASDPDYTALTVLGLFYNHEKKRDEAILLYATQGRWAFPALLRVLEKELAFAYGADSDVSKAMIRPQPLPKGIKPEIDLHPLNGIKISDILIEEKACGLSLLQTLESNFKAKNIQVGISGFNPHSDSKTIRLHAISPVFYHGCIYVPESDLKAGEFANWATDAIKQLTSYSGKNSLVHDDFVDSIVQGIHFLSRAGKMAVSIDLPDAAGSSMHAKGRFKNYYSI